MLTPARARGHEMLDAPDADPALALRSLRDVALANRLFGGRHAVLSALDALWRQPQRARDWTLLDIGTGLGDIPHAATQLAGKRGVTLRSIGLERIVPIAAAASARCHAVCCASAFALPFADHSIDVVTCSQVLHHFEGYEAQALLRECTRVARRAVIVGDLRRSWLAVAGIWSASFALGFHPVSRHDGALSVRRGFTRAELESLVYEATGCRATVRQTPGFRLSACWQPTPTSSLRS
jgi:SAM-dependent methyltransferase